VRIQRTVSFVAAVAFALLAGVPPSAQGGEITYDITVDTSSISTQSGYVDFQFNPGGVAAGLASAAVTNFAPLANLKATDPNNSVSGDVTGSLSSTLTLTNDTAFNDFFEGFTYGSSIAFDVTLSGPAIGSPSGNIGSTFSLGLYASDATTPLLSNGDSDGTVLAINVDPTTGNTYVDLNNTNTTIVSYNATPEPSSVLLFATMFPAGLAIARCRWRTR
jgi:hypothetical protein